MAKDFTRDNPSSDWTQNVIRKAKEVLAPLNFSGLIRVKVAGYPTLDLFFHKGQRKGDQNQVGLKDLSFTTDAEYKIIYSKNTKLLSFFINLTENVRLETVGNPEYAKEFKAIAAILAQQQVCDSKIAKETLHRISRDKVFKAACAART
ncbi:MAG: hypothetical protein LBE03_00750 [Candidatus Nomurabacteria bacterium]|nr:hypothetical protein [Candidatus Nomurabacteria bacterium]